MCQLDAATRAAFVGASATVVSITIAFLGVLLTIRANRIRARDDQLLNLRRETYLEACDHTAEALQYLISLPNPSVTITAGLSVMRRVFGTMGKLQILCDQPALQLLTDYMNAFLGEYVEIAKLKGAFEMNAAEIETANQRINMLSTNVRQNEDAASENRRRLQMQILQLAQDNLSLTEQLASYCPTIPSRLAPLAARVTLALRQELKLPIDEKWYRMLQANTIEVGERRTQVVIEAMRNHAERIRMSRPPW